MRAINVRSGPGTKYKAIRTLPVGPKADVMIVVAGATGQWLLTDEIHIMQNDEKGTDQDMKLRGWVYAPLFATRTQGRENSTVKVWRTASHRSPVAGRLATEVGVTVQGCKGYWVRVRHPKVSGWLDSDSQCGNPVTTCG
jgi:SH3-like domain-containing protein